MAVGSRATTPAPSDDEEYREEPPSGRRIGIALSGGGIRSAAFNLGALQALQEERVLGTADYLAAVSGGNYIASALTISRAYSEPGCENGRAQWAHGSPEERYLRRSTNYLAPGHVGRTWLTMNMLHGFVLNYLPFLLCAFVAGRLIGWPAHWAGIQLDEIRLNGLDLAGVAGRAGPVGARRGRRGGVAALPRRPQGRR
jgi:Patatin-like phospholipase